MRRNYAINCILRWRQTVQYKHNWMGDKNKTTNTIWYEISPDGSEGVDIDSST